MDIKVHLIFMSWYMSTTQGFFVGEMEGAGSCTYNFHVWTADDNMLHNIQELELKINNTAIQLDNKFLQVQNDLLQLKNNRLNTSFNIERELLQLRNVLSEREASVQSMGQELRGQVDDLWSHVSNLETAASELTLSNPQAMTSASGHQPESRTVLQLKNIVNNLKGEWLVIKREVQTTKSKAAHLENIFENISVDTSTLKSYLDELRVMATSLQEKQTHVDTQIDHLQKSLVDILHGNGVVGGDREALGDHYLTAGQVSGTVEVQGQLAQLRGKINTLSERIDRLEIVQGTPSTRRTTTEHPVVEITIDNEIEIVPRDCSEVYQAGHHVSGVYQIHLENGSHPENVYCEMVNRSGWTVIQRRESGLVDFNRTWNSYKLGFGSLYGDFWWGHEFLHKMTRQKKYMLRIDLWDWSGRRYFAEYRTFGVASESDSYRLTVRNYNGNAGDSLSPHNTMAFSTADRDNDLHMTSCALVNKSGWWFDSCKQSNLNGLYKVTDSGWDYLEPDGIVWYTLRDSEFYSLRRSEMKMKPL